MNYELVIIGGGPAGVAAAVYAARKKIKTVIITKDFGGQSVVSDDIQNWIGEPSISGVELAKKLETHVKTYKKEIDIKTGDLVDQVEKIDEGFVVTTKKGEKLETKAVIVAAGARRRKLGVPGEDKFNGKGVAYCSTCDAPLFSGREVAVVGGGNAGLEAVGDLMSYASKIYLLEKNSELKGDLVTQEKIKASDKVIIMTETEVKEIKGEIMVNSLVIEEKGKTKELAVQGIFVEIGSIPNSGLVKDLVQVNKDGEIEVNHKTMQSSCVGIWAAGDTADVLYKQNNISVGDAVKAVLSVAEYLGKDQSGY